MADVGSTDFLATLGISEIGLIILRRAAREFDEHGMWISIDTLAYEFADSDLASTDLNEVYRFPASLGGIWNGEQFALTGLGLMEAGTAPHVSDQMARVARICADRKREFRDGAILSREVLESDYDFSHGDAVRAVELVQRIPGLTSGGTMGDDWWFTLWRGALDYRKIENANDLREHLEQETARMLRLQQRRLVNIPPLALGEIFNPDSTLARSPSELPPGFITDNSSRRSTFLIENLHPWVWNAAAKLWKDGHLREAIASASSAIFDVELPTKMGVHRGSNAAGLVSQVFSTKDPTSTDRRLRFPGLAKGSPDWISAHEGAGSLGRACAMGIRNVTTHGSVPDDQIALEELAALSLLARWIDDATVESA